MVKLLDPTDIDPITEQVENVMDAAEEEAISKRFAFVPESVDLSDKTKIGEVTIRPGRDKRITKGRPAARQAWTWNGTESVLPLAWNPEGNRHDGARHYLLKRHCLCCHAGGFFGRMCKECAARNCRQCNASQDFNTEHKLGNGKTVKGWIIPNFYLRKDDVPCQARVYGSVDCFLPLCPRRGGMGFLSDQDMRVHAMSRHRMEYLAHTQSQAAGRSDQVERLEKRIDELMARQAFQGQSQAPQSTTAVQVARRAAKTGRKWTPERRKAASEAAKRRAAVGVA